MSLPSQARSTSLPHDAQPATPDRVLGSIEPRLWTPPLVDVLNEKTSYGFDVIWFAEHVLGLPLDPWQCWLAAHMGEKLPDGRPRFRKVLVLVSRQNGKTVLGKVLVLYWLFVERVPLILGTSTDRSYAKRTWSEVCDMAKSNEWLRQDLGPGSIRLSIGEETLKTKHGAEYTFAANNGRAGRSTALHRWLCDELRMHTNRDAWNSANNAMNAVRDAQIVAITNQGDDNSILLDELREPAKLYAETGDGDPRLGIFEWSADDGADPTDVVQLAKANPNMDHHANRGPFADVLLGDAMRAKTAGGAQLADFRTEVMCMRVELLDPAIDPDAWLAGGTSEPVDLAEHRERVALCLDVSLDGTHASLVAAAKLSDDRVHVDVVRAWSGAGCIKQVRQDLPDIVAQVRPHSVGWFPTGPAATLFADLKNPTVRWRRVELVELRTEMKAACMALPDLVRAGDLVHTDDPMLTAHIKSAQKLRQGDGFVFQRKGSSPIDGAYALAGAVHIARILKPIAPLFIA